jgi:PAS domain S-box-containing protein
MDNTLSKCINELKSSKIELLRHWAKDDKVYEILKTHKIELKVFLKKYAIYILDSYIKTIENNNKLLECEVLDDFLNLLKNSGVSTSEFFLFFSAFKNSIIYVFNQKQLLNYELIEEITKIHEINFTEILNTYSKRIKDVEKKLSKSEDLIHEYIIISQTDNKGIITDVTQAFCDISGYEREELIGSKHSIIQHPDTNKDIFEDLWKTIKSGKIWHNEIKNKKKNGNSYWVDMRIMPQIDKNGKVESYHAIYQDITSKKRLEEQQDILIEQSKSAAMGEMISMIAHQWRQPLQAVSILTQKLPISKATEGHISDELLTQVVEDITKQLNYMSKTIDDFRDFFLPNKDKEEVSIKEIISRTLDFMNFMFKTDSIEVNIKNDENIVIFTHLNEMIQVLINILKNARDILIEKVEKNRIINISYIEEDAWLKIMIEDNAGGIEESIGKKIFEPYFSTKDEKNGTGLGLYMCKTIIEKHCMGVIDVKNSNIGAVFTIRLPL